MTATAAFDIGEQNAVCTGCGKPIKRYGSDGIWFTDRYDCIAGGLHRPELPDCPNGHGPMTLREGPLTAEQAWCGTWYDCTPAEVGRCCKSSVLFPSAELAAQHAAVSDGA